MNILMLTTEFVPTLGGISTYVVELCKRMPPDVHMHIVTPKPLMKNETDVTRQSTKKHTFPQNVTVHHLGTVGNTFFGTLPFQVNCRAHFRSMLRDFDIDLVHSQSSMPDFLVSAGREDVPIITTIHTTIEGHIAALKQSEERFTEMNSQEKFALVLGPILEALENTYYRSERRYLTVSEWGKRQAVHEKGIAEDKIRVAYNGVNTRVYTPDAAEVGWSRLKTLKNSNNPRVLFLSRLATRKGIHVLAKAIPRVLERVDCHFVIAGLGNPPMIRADKEHVTFLGYVPSDCMPELYATADIYVLPSFYENFPISILEAMASECAVVATRVCGIPEMINHGEDGLLTRPGDVDALTQAIENLVKDESARATFGRRARQKACDKFDWRRTAEVTSECYKDVLSGKM